MFSTTSTSHVLTRQSRAIVAVADTERHRFLAGTCCLREENEIHLIDFDEESNSLAACTVYRHPNEIWSISPNPRDASSFFTSHNTGEPFFLRSFARSRAIANATRRPGIHGTRRALPGAGSKYVASLWQTTGAGEADAGADDATESGEAHRASSAAASTEPLRKLAQLPEHDTCIRSCEAPSEARTRAARG